MRKAGADWFGFEGGILLALGVAAVLIPPAAGLFGIPAAGWLLALSGLLSLLGVLATQRESHPAIGVASAVLGVAAGAFLCLGPATSSDPIIAWGAAAYLGVDGLVTIAFALDQHSREQTHWQALLAAGVLGCALAVVALAMSVLEPGRIGLLIGIDLAAAGAGLLYFSRSSEGPTVRPV